MSEKQPEALRLAEELEDAALWTGISRREPLDHRLDAAAELRRQHALIAELVEALKDTTEFIGLYSNRWDGFKGKHPFGVYERAKAAIANATKEHP